MQARVKQDARWNNIVAFSGREFTKRSDEFLTCDKEYEATIHLGIDTDTYDLEGQVTSRSDLVPTRADIALAIQAFQGQIAQIPPMFAAKKVQGKKLYDLARKGITIERQPVLVELQIELLRYEYPEVDIRVSCSKGTYIRSLAYDIGRHLKTGAHLSRLTRLRSGTFHLSDAIPQALLEDLSFDPFPYLRNLP